MAEAGVIFDRASAERVARTVRAHEREPVNLVGPRVHQRTDRMPAYALFRVKLVQSGGSNGTATSAATWTYHCYWPWDNDSEEKLNTASGGAAVGPERPRGNGTFTAATMGEGYFGETGTFTLAEAWETPGTEECETP